MKAIVLILMSGVLSSCVGNKKADFVAFERESAIDLTSRYIGIVERKYTKIKPAKLSPDGAVRTLGYSYCVGKEFSKDKYLALLGQNCALQGGSMIQNKWCVDSAKNSIKYLVEMDNPKLQYLLQPERVSECAAANTRLDIHIKEFITPKSTDEAEIAFCRAALYPGESIKRRQEGSVTLAITVSAEGNIVSNKVDSTSGSPLLDEAGKFQYSRCVFVPKMRNGNAESATKIFRATFKLAQ
jgi:TonB family protein